MGMKTQIITEKGHVFTLKKKLGEGGQGRVFSLKENVQGKVLAAKIFRTHNFQDRDRLCNRFAAVKRMDLSGIPLARPLELLAPPRTGYIMELATGMASIHSLLTPHKELVAQWFLDTGGLQRRIRILMRLARTLAELHSRGIIYGDLSAQNVFVSESMEHQEVFLIDLDNLRTQTSGHEYIFTPGYGAPEVVNRQAGISSLSDVYSFAVLAFQVLSLVHPFLGDMVSDGEPELEEEAFEGKLPWIEDESDLRNSCSTGVPRNMVLSPKMKRLFSQTFEGGRMDRKQRPGMNQWVETLEGAYRGLLQCPECRSTFFFNVHEVTCAFCGESHKKPVSIYVVAWEPGDEWSLEQLEGVQRAIQRGREDKRFRIATFLALEGQAMDVYENDLLLSRPLYEGKLLIQCIPQKAEWSLEPEIHWLLTDMLSMKTKSLSVTTKLPRKNRGQWLLHFKPLSEPQRAILL